MLDKMKKIIEESKHPISNMSLEFKDNLRKHTELVIWGMLLIFFSIGCLILLIDFVDYTSPFLFNHFDIGSLDVFYINKVDNFRNIYLVGLLLVVLYSRILNRILNLIIYGSYKVTEKITNNENFEDDLNEMFEELDDKDA